MTIQDFFENDAFAKLIGAHLTETSDGYAKAEMLVTPRHLNGVGTCQGGAIFTLADLAIAACLNSHKQVTVSAGANITYVNPGKNGATLVAEAHELVNHHRLPYAECRVTDKADGTLIAIVTSSGYRKKDTFS